MAESDWSEVTYIGKRQQKSGTLKTPKELNAAQRKGLEIETSKKFTGGQNKQHSASKNTAKLDRETEELHHDKLGLDIAKLIQQGRQSKGWTQKDLATKVNEKQNVINEYEAGKAIPNQLILGKLERVLETEQNICVCFGTGKKLTFCSLKTNGMKLRGRDKGQPLGKP